MSNKQRDKVMGKLASGLSAAAVFTQQPGIEAAAAVDGNNALMDKRNNGITEVLNSGLTEELNNDSRRGPKKKGEFKKVTLNLDVELNRKLDVYINTLRGRAIEDGVEPPNKSEWVRDVVEDKLRQLGIME